MYAGTDDNPDLARRAILQQGALHREQLYSHAVSPACLKAHLVAQRWQAVGSKVVLLQNAPPSRAQLRWLAVLDAESLVALGSHTALALAGLRLEASEAEDVHLVVPRGAKVTPLSGVRVHESRRLGPADIVIRQGLPCTRPARAALDAAAWQPWPRFACVVVAAAVQQRVTTPRHLEAELESIGRIRHKAHLRLAIRDIADGAHAIGELDLTEVCRRHGLLPPKRQVPRRDANGRLRYLDAEWQLDNGEVIVLEVDGAHHLDVVSWQADMRRERAIVVSRRRVLRATTMEVRLEAAAVMADLRALGVPIAPSCQKLRRL